MAESSIPPAPAPSWGDVLRRAWRARTTGRGDASGLAARLLARATAPSAVLLAAVAFGTLGGLAVAVLGGRLGEGRSAPVDDLVPRAVAVPVDGPTPSTTPVAPGAAPVGPEASAVVHVGGAVRAAGVYELAPGARVADALAAAGGPNELADLDRLNLAALVEDGSRVWVPARGEEAAPELVAPTRGAVPSPGPPGGPGRAAAPIDLNSADEGALEELPGVGPATAAAIVRYRLEHGPFRSVDELENVAGIGPAKLDQIRDLVGV